MISRAVTGFLPQTALHAPTPVNPHAPMPAPVLWQGSTVIAPLSLMDASFNV
jgi:hypothetical protein